MSTLAKAIALAAQAHVDQVDKAGEPYILHPLRMMMRLAAQVGPQDPQLAEAAQIVAVLHDVVEDTAVGLDDLQAAGFSAAILEAIDCVTRREMESYSEFIERSQSNSLARLVKLADLEDNMDLKRMEKLTEESMARLERYHQAWRNMRSSVRTDAVDG